MLLPIDLTEFPPEVIREMHAIFTRENEVALVQAQARQARIKKHYFDHRPRSMDGIGGMEMAVDPYFINYWRMAAGDGAWEDAEFRKWILKKEEMFRVRHTGTKISVGWNGDGDGKREVVKY